MLPGASTSRVDGRPRPTHAGLGPIARLEASLARLTGRRHVVFTGSGTAALSLVLAAQGRGLVLVPGVCCYAVAAAARFAGREVAVVDVDPCDATIAAASLPARASGATLVAPHLYGHLCDRGALRTWAARAGARLVEDGAQALGGGGILPVGAFGAASVLSFGHTKILDAGGGGALACDDDALAAEVRARAARLSHVEDAAAARAFAGLHEAYYATAAAGARGWLSPILADHRTLFLRAATPARARAILAQLPALDGVLTRRAALASAYEMALRDVPGVRLLRPAPGSVAWRFSLLINGLRDQAAAALRAAGVHASTWYPSLGHLLDLPAATTDVGAREVAGAVVNLWTDPAVADERAVREAAAVLRRVTAAGTGT